MSTLINTENPDIMWEDWKTKFLAVADIHAPYITRKVRNDYMCPGLRQK